MNSSKLSIVVLAWDQLPLTRACVDSIRNNTDVEYELIIVDNGSQPEAVAFANQAADRVILNEENRGFAAGMNQGLAAATGQQVAFVNNDTAFPAGWAEPLIGLVSDPQVGIVAPVVTAAGNPVTVRSQTSDNVVRLNPFAELPSGVVYVMRTALIRALGGWNESYPVASSEDLDLAFTVWTNDLAIVVDERVLIEHVSRGTVKAKLPDRTELYRSNLNRFLDRWAGSDEVIRLDSCEPAIHARNRAAGRAAAVWLRRLIEERESRRVEQPTAVRRKRFGR